jgi:uncharacterized membrane protein YeaQ/YmgE (transglycosylase-associated protein family)
MNLTAWIVQIIGGALGGYAVGYVPKEMNLGTIGNAIVGALGGGVGGQVLVVQRIGGFGARIEELSAQARGHAKPHGPSKRRRL